MAYNLINKYFRAITFVTGRKRQIWFKKSPK